MQSGELVVARLGGSLSIATCLGVESARARISTGGKKESRISVERIVLSTGVMAPERNDLAKFRDLCTAIMEELDLTEVWEVVRDEQAALSLDDVAGLYWGDPPSPAHKVALLLTLEGKTPYFQADKRGYMPRTEDAVHETFARKQREEEHRQEIDALVASLARGSLPGDMSPYQQSLVDHLRGFAVHGDSFARADSARSLLERLDRPSRDPQRQAFDLLLQAGVFAEDEPLELERAGIGGDFPNEVVASIAGLNMEGLLSQLNRRDFTSLPTITIDDEGTRDRDDALSLETITNPDTGETTYRVGIHIADAASLVTPGSPLDVEADKRMATLYMPERKVMMVPDALANEIGSLLPGETRAAFTLMVTTSESGDVLATEVTQSVIRSDAALSYEEADRAIRDANHPWHDHMTSLHRIGIALRAKRDEAGAVNLDRPEMLVEVAESGEVRVRVVPRATPARQTVSEFMILCNSMLAAYCSKENLPAAYRSQSLPDLSDLADLPEGPLRWFLTVRRLTPAVLDTVPGKHGALGVPAYMQISSPLRRYPDLVLQRQVETYIATGRPFYSTDEIASVAQRADMQIRELSRIEDERRRYWFLKYLGEMHGLRKLQGKPMLYDAIVLENQEGRYAQLELIEYPFRVRAQLPATIQPGETVSLRLHGVDLWRKFPQFIHER